MSPYYEQDGVTLWLGEALALLVTLPAALVDCVITDPPYSSGGAFRGDRMAPTNQKYTPHTERGYSSFSGDTRDQRSYLLWCSLWLSECLRVTKPGSVCCVFTDWRQLPTTTDALQAGGWVWRGIVPWDKTEAARPAKGRFRNQCEYIVWGSNGSLGVEYEGDGDCHPGFFREAVHGSEKWHNAQKPLGVMRGLVRICPPGGLILDPFMGAGTTGAAALLEGRRFLGVEKDEEYCAIAARRLRNTTPPLPLLYEAEKQETLSLEEV